MQSVRPTILTAVPRVLEVIRARVLARLVLLPRERKRAWRPLVVMSL